MKKLSILSFIISIQIFTACSSNNIIIKDPSNTIKDEKKGYIVFTMVDSYLSSAMIVEFNIYSDNAKFIVELDRNQKYTAHVSPGKHYYYLEVNSDAKHIIQIDVKAGETVNINALMGTVIPKSRAELTSKIKKVQCTEKALRQFCFKPYTGKKPKKSLYSDNSNLERYDSDILLYSIFCDKDKTNKLVDNTLISEEDIFMATQVKPVTTKKHGMRLVRGEIDKSYNFIINTHHAVSQKVNGKFNSDYMYSMDIVKFTNKQNLYKYNRLSLSSTNNSGDLSPEEITDLEVGFNNTFKNQKLSSGIKNILLEYTIHSYEHGNQAARYFGITQAQRDEGMESLSMNIVFIDSDTRKIIGEIEYASFLKGGLFGGTFGLLGDAVKHVTKYAKMNFTQK